MANGSTECTEHLGNSTHRDIVVPVAIPHKQDSRTHHRNGLFLTFSRIPKASGRYFVHFAVSGDSDVLGDDEVVVVVVVVVVDMVNRSVMDDEATMTMKGKNPVFICIYMYLYTRAYEYNVQ
jgi:hypothetical protein